MINGHPVHIIAAADQKNGIGKDGDLPWSFRYDMKHFAKITTRVNAPKKRNMVIMGRTTWESLPETVRPLKNRKNVILTRQEGYTVEHADVVSSLEEAYALADESIETIFIIGGAQVYADSINRAEIDGVYLTRIHETYDCDTFFPNIPKHFASVRTLASLMEKRVRLDMMHYVRTPR